MVRLPRRSLIACLLPFAAALPVHADEADVINLRASVSTLWDDNLFRTASNQNPTSDLITTTIVGADFNKRVSLQQFIARVSWVDTHYQKSGYLNAGSLQYDGRWLWAMGSQLKGEMGVERTSAQNAFSDFQGLRQRNLRTTETQRFAVDYAVNPSWHVTGGLSHVTVANDQPLAQATSDLEASSTTLGLRYTPKSGNWAGFQSRRTEGRYFNRQFIASSPIDTGYSETGQELSAGWQVTGHSTFNGRLEFVQREHPNLSSRDFSGWAGQLGYQYQYSAKTLLTAGYLRGLYAYQDPNSSYYISDDLLVGSRWDATAKVSVATRLSYSHRRYQGALPTANLPQREDDVVRAGADIIYKAANWLELKGGIAAERRESSLAGLSYTDRQLLLSAIARF